MGILDRDTREMRAKVVPNVKRETLQAQILEHVTMALAFTPTMLAAIATCRWTVRA